MSHAAKTRLLSSGEWFWVQDFDVFGYNADVTAKQVDKFTWTLEIFNLLLLVECGCPSWQGKRAVLLFLYFKATLSLMVKFPV